MSLQLFCLYTHRYSLALVMTLVLVTAATDDIGPTTNTTVVLGRTTTFICPFRKGWTVQRLYIQRVKDSQEIFINGFYLSRDLGVRPEYLHRTIVNKLNLSMELTNVSVSDEGLYKCLVFYDPAENPPYTKTVSEIHLKVTAEYSVPTMESKCTESKRADGAAGKSCQLSCSSVGGYPQSVMKWAGLNHSLMSVIHNESSEDPYSKTWTINHTIMYICDHPVNVSCAVEGSVSSPAITICEIETFSIKVIVAIAVVLVFVLLLLLVLIVMKRCYRRQQPEDQVDPEDVALRSPDCRSQLKSV